MSAPMILASASPFRRQLMAAAGLEFEVVPPQIDERAVEAPLDGAGLAPQERASILAEAKAAEVSAGREDIHVVGSDQILALDGEVLHKPADMEAARRRLLQLSDRTHELHSAVVICLGGRAIWRHVATARLTMRALDAAFVGRHLARVGNAALSSVGAYQIEGEGIQLFETIEGDHFTIVGLPLLPLLKQLRALDVIDG